MAGSATPFLERILLARYSPAALAKRERRTVAAVLELLSSFPKDLSQLLRAARRGKLQAQVEVLRLRPLGRQIDRAASRLAVSVVTAALIVGSAIVMTVERGRALPGLPSFGLLGFTAAVIGVIWLSISIGRSGKG
jgi:ubiquinone biosynthesis protein